MFKVDGFETIKGQWRLFSFKEVNLFMLGSYVEVIFGAVLATNSPPAVEQGLLLLERESSFRDTIILQDDLRAKQMFFDCVSFLWVYHQCASLALLYRNLSRMRTINLAPCGRVRCAENFTVTYTYEESVFKVVNNKHMPILWTQQGSVNKTATGKQ